MPRAQLTARQLGQLVEIVPVAVAWLRQAGPTAGDLFLEDGDVTLVQALLLELLDTLNLEGDPSVSHLRAIFSKFHPQVLACAMRVTILEGEPRFVPPHVATALIGLLDTLQAYETASECAAALGPLLDELPRKHYYALAEILALWRDASSDPAELACLCGPVLLGPERTAALSEQQASAHATASAGLLNLLIEECELIFGRVCARSAHPGLGARSAGYRAPDATKPSRAEPLSPSSLAEPASPVLSPRSAPAEDGDDLRHGAAAGSRSSRHRSAHRKSTSARKSRRASSRHKRQSTGSSNTARLQQLITFYNWRDPLKAGRAHLLFENYDFLTIARAFYCRQPEAMPAAWKAELAELQASGEAALPWFDGARADLTEDDASEALSPRSPTSPAAKAVDAPWLDAKRVSGAPPPPPPPPRPSSLRSPVDSIIDEFIDTEHHYHDCLADAIDFGKHILNVARGIKGSDARNRLGLSPTEIETVFGFRLSEIVQLSKRLLANLEVIDVVREEPRCPGGRVALAADAMLAVIADLHVYAPYVSSHNTIHRTIKSASETVRRKAASKRRPSLKPGTDKYKGTFEEIWTAISSASDRLKGQNLLSVLIMPIQRIPRYRLLFVDLAKKLDADHPAARKVAEVTELVGEMANQINDALRQHEKLSALLGESVPLPDSSRAGLKRTGSVKDIKHKFAVSSTSLM